MICPKCGLDQEERLDCKECGIVFSKYNALFPSDESSDSIDEEALMKSKFQDLQIQVRELGSRFIDVEFEKAERKKIRSELKDLEQQIQQNQLQTETRMQRMEERLESCIQESEQQVRQNQAQAETRIQQTEEKLDNFIQESEQQIAPEILEILPKSEEIEQKASELTDKLNHTINQLTSLWEKTGQNSFQITELHDLVISLRNEILEAKNQMESIQKNQDDEEPKTIYEDDVKAIRKNLDELGQFISGLGRKQ